MSVGTMAKAIKEVHPEYVICYKVGMFFQCIGKDSYIMVYLFNYKLNKNKEGVPVCGFPAKAIPRVKSKLEKEKINYILIDTRNNYDVDEKFDNKNLNKYDEIFQESKSFVRKRNRIDGIYDKLMQDINGKNIKEKLSKVEEIIYEK